MTRRFASFPSGLGLTPRRASAIVLSILVALLGVGCAADNVATGANKLPQPRHVIVYDFASTAMEISPDSAFAGKLVSGAPPPAAAQVALAKEVGTAIAKQLVEELKAMGIPAVHSAVGHQPVVNDLVLRGYVVSSDAAGQMSVIGFSSASPNFGAALEGFQMTLHGLNRLGSGVTSDPIGLVFTSGSKMGGDGSRVDARAREIAQEIARILKPRFQAQGWVK